jgi:hypothetical protein
MKNYYQAFLDYLFDILEKEKVLQEYQVKKIFIMALKDFFEKKIDMRTLSSVACELYFEIKVNDPPIRFYERELDKNLYWASEAEYFCNLIKEQPVEKFDPQFCQKIIDDLKKYFEENRHLFKL